MAAISLPQPEGFPKVTAATRGNSTSIEFASDRAAQKFEQIFKNSQNDVTTAFYFEGHKLRAMLDEEMELRARKSAMHGVREALNVLAKRGRLPYVVPPRGWIGAWSVAVEDYAVVQVRYMKKGVGPVYNGNLVERIEGYPNFRCSVVAGMFEVLGASQELEKEFLELAKSLS